MTNYKIVFDKMEELCNELANNDYSFDDIYNESENIKELRELSSEMQNPQPITYSFA
ncbi:hypothetical protein AB4J90_11975 [Geobacillus thermodenitrificans]|uniref:Uncharacterized protein n=1 Tax=Aeribacillus composti TaxID=1868734 RepID=A0ABY9WKI9_9BACI|nr:hypothetical protein [Aeribacillus composti]WNF33826.1 hypothetical protein RI196_03830 [Aeribacillus composti]